MANATMSRIRAKLRDGNFSTKTSGDPDELLPITFELFPEELVEATAAELKMEDYIKNIYLFGIAAQQANAQVKKQQLGGMILTHNKLRTWLANQGARSIVDIENKTVLRAYLNFHRQRLADSMEAINLIADELSN